MYRLMCGTSLIKLIKHAKEPKAAAPPGGINGATGYRYWTISVVEHRRDGRGLRGRRLQGGRGRSPSCGPASPSPWSRTPTATGWSSSPAPERSDRQQRGAARQSTGRRTAVPRLSWGRGSSALRGSPRSTDQLGLALRPRRVPRRSRFQPFTSRKRIEADHDEVDDGGDDQADADAGSPMSNPMSAGSRACRRWRR